MNQSIGVLVKSLETLGGGERVAVNLCNALESACDIHLIQFYENKSVYALSKSIPTYFLSEKKGRLRHNIAPYICKLRDLIKKLKLKTLIVVGKFSLPIIAMISTLGLNTKVIFWEQGTLEAAKYVRNTIKKSIFGIIQQKIINYRADLIVTLTNKECNNYQFKFPETKGKVVFIPNFITINKELPTYNIEAKQIISVGRIDYAKGYEYLIDVASKVMPKNPEWQWHIYGSGDKGYIDSLQHRIDQLGISSQVILKGSHNDILEVYDKYSFFVFTSRFEGFGLVLLEAMLNGLPLVSFDIYSGPSDMIRHDENGYLVEPYNVNKMAFYIDELIKDDELRLYMHQHSRDYIESFSEKEVVKKWLKVLNEHIRK